MTRRSFTFVALVLAVCAGCAHGGTQAAGTTATSSATFGNSSRGAQVFRADCAVCHAANAATGGIGPPLAGESHRKDYAATVAWIEEPDPPMPKLYPSPLSLQDVEDVATYVQSL
jgi:mono/diheme cytochrome c family protein